MHILIVCEYYQPVGGTEQYVLSVADAIESQGHRTTFLFGVQTEQTIRRFGRRAHHVPEIMRPDGRLDRGSVSRIRGIIASERPDVAYFQNVPNFGLIQMISEALPSFRYVHDHRLYCPKSDKMFLVSGRTCSRPFGIGCYLKTFWRGCLHPFPRVSLPLIRQSRRSIAIHRKLRLVVASDFMKNCLLYNGFSPDRIGKIPYYSNLPVDTTSECGEFVFFCGRLIRQKGLKYLIRSMKAWPDSLHLVVAGDGPQKNEMQALAARNGLGRRITFLGAISNLDTQPYFQKCLCLAVPSIWDEPFGIVGIEAMGCAKPVVAFDVGGVTEWLTDGQNGILVSRKDVAALGRAIERLGRDRQLAERMGRNGRGLYMERFRKELHLERLLNAFASNGRGSNGFRFPGEVPERRE